MRQASPPHSGRVEAPDFDGTCQRFRGAILPLRPQSLSVHDHKGDVLYLCEDSLGPDEHSAAIAAIDALSRPDSPSFTIADLGDNRSAVSFRIGRAGRPAIGSVMIVGESRGIANHFQTKKLGDSPAVRNVVQEFARLLKEEDASADAPAAPAQDRRNAAEDRRSGPVDRRTGAEERRNEPQGRFAAAEERRGAVQDRRMGSQERRVGNPDRRAPAEAAPPTRPVMAEPAVRPVPAARQPAPVTPALDRLNAELRRAPLALYAQRLVPLRTGGQVKRYEILLRSPADAARNGAPQGMLKTAVDHGLGSMIDRRVLADLLGWLAKHKTSPAVTGAMFSVNLTRTALQDEHFTKFLELCIAKAQLPQGSIAFELPAEECLKLQTSAMNLAVALHRLGCPLILDDFDVIGDGMSLLRLPGLKMIKLASRLTQEVRKDKVTQAAIAAMVQAARVLGLHTVAKRAETAPEKEWLTALGVDFIQSVSSAAPAPLNDLVA